MNRKFIQLPVLLLLIFIPSPQARGAHHAVLIGIRDYPNAMPLYGPLNDVASVKKVLVEKYGFIDGNITVLLDGDATKSGILDTLAAIDGRTRPGDFIFVYYSGHGTSDYNPETGFVMGRATGAILPYDFKLFPGNIDRTLDRLIIGRRDLRPIFERLDEKRQLLVVFDACFSGNATRAKNRQPGRPKYTPLPFPTRRGKIRGIQGADTQAKTTELPYKNLIYISASDTTEKAIDLPTGSRYDGKAHGALTDVLLLGLSGAADTDGNREVTYRELYRFVKLGVQVYGHTPQIHTRRSLDRPVFEMPGKVPIDAAMSTDRPLVVNLRVNNRSSLEKRVSALAGIASTPGRYNLLVEQETQNPVGKSGFSLYLPSGDRLCRVEGEDQVVKRIERFVKIKDLVKRRNPNQTFNVWLDAGPLEGKTVYHEDETIDVSIRSEADAHFLVFNVDPHGNINLLIPNTDRKETFIESGQKVTLHDNEIFPPFGVEYLKLFAFKGKIDNLARFSRYAKLKPESRDYAELMRVIATRTRPGSDWAETSMQVVTLASFEN